MDLVELEAWAENREPLDHREIVDHKLQGGFSPENKDPQDHRETAVHKFLVGF